jgi:hypothetical protein
MVSSRPTVRALAQTQTKYGHGSMELPDPPDGWQLKSLIERDGTWFAFLYSSTEWCQAAGSTPRYAMLDGLRRIEDGAVYMNLSGMKKRPEINLADLLGIKPAPVDRRE